MNIKAIVYLPIMILLVLFGLIPFQNIHAMSMSMDHDMSSMDTSSANCCTSPNPSAVLDQRQKSPNRDEDEDPTPPQQIPYYAQAQSFDTQDTPPKLNIFGAGLLRPPDLVVLYSNFRI